MLDVRRRAVAGRRTDQRLFQRTGRPAASRSENSGGRRNDLATPDAATVDSSPVTEAAAVPPSDQPDTPTRIGKAPPHGRTPAGTIARAQRSIAARRCQPDHAATTRAVTPAP